MKKNKDFLFSMLSSVILLALFALSIGIATFVEHRYGTPVAKTWVYHAFWFKILLFLMTINLLGSIVRYKLVQNKKWGGLAFHLAFVFILIGAVITHYFGTEGIMHLRQGETSNEISTEKSGVKVSVNHQGKSVVENSEVDFSSENPNLFVQTIAIGDKKITVENELFVPNAEETVIPDENGEPIISIFVMSGAEQSADLILFGDDVARAGSFSFAFSKYSEQADVLFSVNENQLYFNSYHVITKTGTLASGMIDKANAITIPQGELCMAAENTIYRVDKLVFMIKGFMPKAIKTLIPGAMEGEIAAAMSSGRDALVLKVSDGKLTRRINVFKSPDGLGQAVNCQLNDVNVSVQYGQMPEVLPFSITLRKFELERYAGSMSPSSFASEITLTDTEMKSVRPFRIYMNNILNYRGYRFFQSSYDPDEQGTVLSVNHDFWGTNVTYFGYLLMLIGMVVTLFSKNSRFGTLLKLTNEIQAKRKASKLLALLIFLIIGQAATAAKTVSKSEHYDLLNSLLVQNAGEGRIMPLSSYAADVLRKVYKHNRYKDQTGVAVLLGMTVDATLWKNEALIKVAHPELERELNAVNGYVSYNQLIDLKKGGMYRLQAAVEKTYQKEESSRNKYEKELLNVDERFNICTQIYSHALLALFPVPGDQNGKWTVMQAMATMPASMGLPSAMGQSCPASAEEKMKGMKTEVDPAMEALHAGDGKEGSNPHAGLEEMQASGMDTELKPDAPIGSCTRAADGTMITQESSAMNMPEELLQSYFDAVSKAFKSGDWATASERLNSIKSYQLANGGELLPSESKIKLEISYNNWNIFLNLAIVYSIFGALLIFLHFFNIFKYHPRVDQLLEWAVYPLALLFLVYSAGMAIRWNISGHAPWSNGYEIMLFVGWAASLAGLVFSRKSALAFAATALLSAIALSVAGMSWMNPEITNLVPVLKSYWLIVHVAVISSSYGFLALGAILGFLNLILIIGKNPKNAARLSDNILEISYIIELSLTVGLFMLTVGTFLGGVWANESWGRYWGWDAKETWALVSVLVYAVILHLRFIPKLNTPIVLSAVTLVGFSSVIMTFLGVNYYLSGMHSYGQGTPPTLPNSLFVVIVVVLSVIFLAFRAERKKVQSFFL